MKSVAPSLRERASSRSRRLPGRVKVGCSPRNDGEGGRGRSPGRSSTVGAPASCRRQ